MKLRPLLLLPIVFACRGTATQEPVTTPAPVASAPTTDLHSIYDLGIRLQTASGDPVGLDAARGTPVLITMFYASCSVACPALIGDVKRTLDELGRDDVRVLLVSFDPARDTPAQLAALARAHQLDARWIVATAREPDARTLAATLGYKYRKLDNGEFFHGATIIALDVDGRPIARSEGFNQRAPLVVALQQ